MFKPRLKRMRDGSWRCALPDNDYQSYIVGLGATPKEAYNDWLLEYFGDD